MKEDRGAGADHQPDPNYLADHLFNQPEDLKKRVHALLQTKELKEKQHAYYRPTIKKENVDTKKVETTLAKKYAMQAVLFQPYEIIQRELTVICSEKFVTGLPKKSSIEFNDFIQWLRAYLMKPQASALASFAELKDKFLAAEEIFKLIQTPSLEVQTFEAYLTALYFYLTVSVMRHAASARYNEKNRKLVNHPDEEQKCQIRVAECDAITFIKKIETDCSLPCVMLIMRELMAKLTPEASDEMIKKTMHFGMRVLHESNESQCRLLVGATLMGEYLKENHELILANFKELESLLQNIELSTHHARDFTELKLWLNGLCLNTLALTWAKELFMGRYVDKKIFNKQKIAKGYRDLISIIDLKIKQARAVVKTHADSIAQSGKSESLPAIFSPTPERLMSAPDLSVNRRLSAGEETHEEVMPMPQSSALWRQLASLEADDSEMIIASVRNAFRYHTLSDHAAQQLSYLKDAMLMSLKRYQADIPTRFGPFNKHHALAGMAIDSVKVAHLDEEQEELVPFVTLQHRLVDILIECYFHLKPLHSVRLLDEVTSLLLGVHHRLKSLPLKEEAKQSEEAVFLALLSAQADSPQDKINSLRNAVYACQSLSENLKRELGYFRENVLSTITGYSSSASYLIFSRYNVDLAQAAEEKIKPLQLGDEREIMLVLFELQIQLAERKSGSFLEAVNGLLLSAYKMLLQYQPEETVLPAAHARLFAEPEASSPSPLPAPALNGDC